MKVKRSPWPFIFLLQILFFFLLIQNTLYGHGKVWTNEITYNELKKIEKNNNKRNYIPDHFIERSYNQLWEILQEKTQIIQDKLTLKQEHENLIYDYQKNSADSKVFLLFLEKIESSKTVQGQLYWKVRLHICILEILSS